MAGDRRSRDDEDAEQHDDGERRTASLASTILDALLPRLREEIRRQVRRELRAKEMSLSEAAAALGYSRDHTRKLAKAGQIPHRRVGKRYVFTQQDLDAYRNGEGDGEAA